MVRYMKCPRCELNYIDAETQEYCDVCLKELKGIHTDADEIEESEDLDLATELCPVCGENMMHLGEKMCEECRNKMDFEPEPDEEDDDEWREYLDDDTDLDEVDDLGEAFGEEFEDDLDEEDEEEEEHYDDEDMDYVTADEIYSLSDDDDDEDDEDSDGDDF